MWQLLACSVIAFLKYNSLSQIRSSVFQAENSLTARACIGEVLTQVLLKSVKK